jgi:hypothetical protein
MKRDPVGLIVGILTFLGGIALLYLTFQQAFILFQRSPADALGIQPNKPVDGNVTAQAAIALFGRIFVLLLMCVIASIVCNRGIRLYQTAIGDAPDRRRRSQTVATDAASESETAGN